MLAQFIATGRPLIRAEKGAPLIANTPAAALALADDLGAADRRRDHPQDGLAKTRRPGARPIRRVLAAHARIPEDRAQLLAGASEGNWGDRCRRSARPAYQRRDAKRLAGSNAPVIAAGSTGSMPATAKLLAAIAQLPHGAVVLPGLDTDLDEDSWREIAGSET